MGENEDMKKKSFISLKTKLTLSIIAICLIIGSIAFFAIRRLATDIIDKEYEDKAEQLAAAMAQTLDTDEIEELTNKVMDIYYDQDTVVFSSDWGSDAWNKYQAKYSSIESDPLYRKIQDELRVYQDIYRVDCIYVTKYKTEIRHAVYIVDGAYDDDNCPPGCIDSFEDGLWPDDENPIIPATLTNEEVYGWLVSSSYPLIKDGKVISHVCVDISMDDIKAKEKRYMIFITAAMVILTTLMILASLRYFNKTIIYPIKELSDTAKNYCQENNDAIHHAFEKINILNNDEIGDLLSSMKQMEADMNANINTLINTQVALQKSQELANKDSLTGIRNKTAYDAMAVILQKDLEDGFNEFGLAMIDLNFLKKTNDTYGHEKGNISIRRLCMLVCEVFEHSPVFRIGGDEFIVVLKFRDYKNVDNLITDFNNRLEAVKNDDTLNPWEQISAAIGYAKFDKTIDKTVEDVFKRADKAMYERKTSMKAARTD